MATILELVRARMAVIANDPVKAEDTGRLATAALHAGIGKDAWEDYIHHFEREDLKFTPAQLLRLTTQIGGSDLDRKRAYIVGNGTCGMASPNTAGLDRLVESIDNGLGVSCPFVEANPQGASNSAAVSGSVQA